MASLSPRMLVEAPAKVGRRRIRVLIADGSPMGCQLLESAFKRFRRQFGIVASAVSKDEVIRHFSRHGIDVALINSDLEDGRFAGLQVLREVHASHPRTRVIILFDAWQDDLIVDAFRAGAKGVFCRSEKKLDMLCRCIQAVHQGQVWANSEQLQLLLKAVTSAAPVRAIDAQGLNLLAKRETQVVNFVAEGLPNKEIARKLGISEHTVSNYLFRVYNKLGISSRVELALYVTKQKDAHSVLPGTA